MPPRHRLNVVGDFYVASECCLACGLPSAYASDLFGYEDADGCYVKRQPVRQPARPHELTRMLAVVRDQEQACVRYAGKNAAIVAAIRAFGRPDELGGDPID
jgi:ferredoxin